MNSDLRKKTHFHLSGLAAMSRTVTPPPSRCSEIWSLIGSGFSSVVSEGEIRKWLA